MPEGAEKHPTKQHSPQDSTAFPEPESVQSVREVLKLLTAAIERGEVDAVTVVTISPNNDYSILNSIEFDRHEHAGLLMEAAMRRLGFAKEDT